MAVVERKVFIQAPYPTIEQVAVYSPQDWNQWFEGVQSVQVSENYPAEGAHVVLQYHTSGISFELKQTLVKMIPGATAIFQMDGMITGTQTWTGQPEGNGVWISVVFDYDIPGGGVGKLLDKLVIERINVKNLEKSLENLKAFIENQ